jgi:hypothetical protein
MDSGIYREPLDDVFLRFILRQMLGFHRIEISLRKTKTSLSFKYGTHWKKQSGERDDCRVVGS